VLEIDDTGEVVEAPQPRRRRGARYSAAEDRELILQAAFAEIAVADPAKLRQIIDRLQALRFIGRMGKRARKVLEVGRIDERTACDADLIIERAERRLRALERQADPPAN
jgi:hypothetical protein